ncbi:MAG: hypothetical protein IJT86_02820 [Spirochaetales bacterium]|nr:hypothetical protein [Spirochaetales bacterium]MBQ7281653.1 hypothetical protein [Spirochaetales bacterium]MBQ7729263.1 hypothetical protein [Spirochaetales bacterium]MBQ9810397.1 hypothetical protein [Spirochaetales bacterium]
MADFKSLLKSAVSGAINSDENSSSDLDLSKVKSIVESILGSKPVLEGTLGNDGTSIVDAASNVKQVLEKGLENGAVRKALSLLKDALAKVEGNALCSTVAKKLEAMGI